MARPKEQQLYKGLTSGAFALGKTLPQRKGVDVTKFKGLPETVKATGAPSAGAGDLSRFKALGTVTVPYGGKTKFERFHPGYDVAAPIGTKLQPFAGGVVTGMRTGQVQTPGKPSFGNFVIIQDNQGNYHRYSHLNNVYIKVGQQVTPKTLLGTIGATGGAYSTHGGSGAHLDYRIWKAFQGQKKYYDPAKYLGIYNK